MAVNGLIKLLTVATLAVSLAAFHNMASAQSYYRWKDEKGRLVVSDRPPVDDVEYDVVTTGSSLVRRVRPGEGAVPPETVPRPGNRFEPVDQRQAAMEVVTKNPESCTRARSNLETLKTAARIRIRDDNGELRFLSEEEKEAQRQKAMDTMKVHCEN